jgi:cell division septation protein DedD
MRFEIRFGGAFVILVGLFTLSGAVFLLGLYAGYQMARQNQPASTQISSTYPLPSAPPGTAPPVSASSPAAISSPAVASAAAKPIVPRPAASIAPAIAAPVAPASHSTNGAIARAKPPAIAPAVRPPADTDEDEDDSDTADSATTEPPPAASGTSAPLKPGHKPYNIQIEAVMDKSGADEMVNRLRGLGYNAQESTTSLEGQTWYRVKVGPYNSEDDAREAEQKLRDQYKHAFAPH